MLNTMFIIFMCVHIFVLTNVVRSELKCKHGFEKKIFLINKASQDMKLSDIFGNEQEVFQAMNTKLKEMCDHFYNIEFSNFDMSINDTLKAIAKQNNVINLWVRDYYDFSSNEHIEKRFVYAGDVVYQPFTSFNFPINNIPEFDSCINSKGQENPKRIAKIVSNSVAKVDSGDFVDFISSIQYENNAVTSRLSCMKQADKTTDLKIVLICSDEWMHNCLNRNRIIAKNLKFKSKPTSACAEFVKIYQNNLLAVLAPAPFEMDYEISIPMIFYQTPYLYPEHKSHFPNSMNLVSGLLLKHVFMRFINEAGWRRVAIISDDTQYSTDFEREILESFHRKQMLYNVQRCSTSGEFEEAISYLVRVDARIIIANVNEENAKKLANIVNQRKKKFIILFRVTPFWHWIPDQIQNWISITMGPSIINNFEKCFVEENSVCSEILFSLGIIAAAHEKYLYPEDLHRTSFYRKFAETMANMIPSGSVAYIQRFNEEISKLNIRNSGVISNMVTYKVPFNTEIPDQNECIAKINDFARPCDHAVYLYIMFVVIMFAIMVLTITCYFHESSPLISNSYQQL